MKITTPPVNLVHECPHCAVRAKFDGGWAMAENVHQISTWAIGRCAACAKHALWELQPLDPKSELGIWKLVYPRKLFSLPPPKDLPDRCLRDYDEARKVFGDSPRSASAMLRLCIDTFCDELEAKGSNFNDKIGDLVKKGLDERVQKALDVVRVGGNGAVHPGELSDKDNAETATALFSLVHRIVDDMITKPMELDKHYNKLPAKVLEQIRRRDAKP